MGCPVPSVHQKDEAAEKRVKKGVNAFDNLVNTNKEVIIQTEKKLSFIVDPSPDFGSFLHNTPSPCPSSKLALMRMNSTSTCWRQ
jgi:hypothetical protein